jgi:hypothetical protein
MFFGCCVTARYPVVIESTAPCKQSAKEINRSNHLFRLSRLQGALPPLFLSCCARWGGRLYHRAGLVICISPAEKM